MFPLEQRAAKSILLKSSEIDTIKSRLTTEGPTEENIQALVVGTSAMTHCNCFNVLTRVTLHLVS